MFGKRFPVFMSAFTLFLGAALGGCSTVKTPVSSKIQIANPASEYCISHGGTLVIQKHPDGGEYGMCLFPGNMQCEEWAMFQNECPLGGIDMTGYASEAARFCAATGGSYLPPAGKGDDEQGICSFQNGISCEAGEYFAGRCSKETGKIPPP